MRIMKQLKCKQRLFVSISLMTISNKLNKKFYETLIETKRLLIK